MKNWIKISVSLILLGGIVPVDAEPGRQCYDRNSESVQRLDNKIIFYNYAMQIMIWVKEIYEQNLRIINLHQDIIDITINYEKIVEDRSFDQQTKLVALQDLAREFAARTADFERTAEEALQQVQANGELIRCKMKPTLDLGEIVSSYSTDNLEELENDLEWLRGLTWISPSNFITAQEDLRTTIQALKAIIEKTKINIQEQLDLRAKLAEAEANYKLSSERLLASNKRLAAIREQLLASDKRLAAIREQLLASGKSLAEIDAYIDDYISGTYSSDTDTSDTDTSDTDTSDTDTSSRKNRNHDDDDDDDYDDYDDEEDNVAKVKEEETKTKKIYDDDDDDDDCDDYDDEEEEVAKIKEEEKAKKTVTQSSLTQRIRDNLPKILQELGDVEGNELIDSSVRQLVAWLFECLRSLDLNFANESFYRMNLATLNNRIGMGVVQLLAQLMFGRSFDLQQNAPIRISRARIAQRDLAYSLFYLDEIIFPAIRKFIPRLGNLHQKVDRKIQDYEKNITSEQRAIFDNCGLSTIQARARSVYSLCRRSTNDVVGRFRPYFSKALRTSLSRFATQTRWLSQGNGDSDTPLMYISESTLRLLTLLKTLQLLLEGKCESIVNYLNTNDTPGDASGPLQISCSQFSEILNLIHSHMETMAATSRDSHLRNEPQEVSRQSLRPRRRSSITVTEEAVVVPAASSVNKSSGQKRNRSDEQKTSGQPSRKRRRSSSIIVTEVPNEERELAATAAAISSVNESSGQKRNRNDEQEPSGQPSRQRRRSSIIVAEIPNEEGENASSGDHNRENEQQEVRRLSSRPRRSRRLSRGTPRRNSGVHRCSNNGVLNPPNDDSFMTRFRSFFGIFWPFGKS